MTALAIATFPKALIIIGIGAALIFIASNIINGPNTLPDALNDDDDYC